MNPRFTALFAQVNAVSRWWREIQHMVGSVPPPQQIAPTPDDVESEVRQDRGTNPGELTEVR